MNITSRQKFFQEHFPVEPAFRWKQIEQALFVPEIQGWGGVTTLSKAVRQELSAALPWTSFTLKLLADSADQDTFKALLETVDGKFIETVLMRNRREQWTICVSAQVGCAMRCAFCATGKMGLSRNLSSDEIVDQYRFWRTWLLEKFGVEERISNVVMMGMGEPMSNYEEVKAALNLLLDYTDLGATKITVSTVGILPRLEQILTDKEWPPVRIAVSLHSAIEETRKKIVPSTAPDFIEKLKDWGKRYLKKCGNRRHHLTFEYVMLSGVNDDERHASTLAKLVNSIGDVKVNLIPYHQTSSGFNRSSEDNMERFTFILAAKSIIFTVRKSMGEDIQAACGQLSAELG